MRAKPIQHEGTAFEVTDFALSSDLDHASDGVNSHRWENGASKLSAGSGELGGSTFTPLDGQMHSAPDGSSTFVPVDGFNNITGDPVSHLVFTPPDNALATSGASVISAVNDTIGWFPAEFNGSFTGRVV